MLTDKERQEQARLARILLQQKRVAKNKNTLRSGDVPCYLSSMTEDKKASKGFYYCPDTAKLNHLKTLVKKAKKPADIIRIERA